MAQENSIKTSLSSTFEEDLLTRRLQNGQTPYNSYNSTISYRPSVTPRSVIIQRNTYTSGSGASGSGGYGSGGSGSVVRREKSYQLGSSSGMALSAGSYSALTTSGVTSVKSSREKEKKDMQDLNERFASYIEKVRFLEAQNRRLVDELEKLKSKWGKETTQIKAMYQAELDEARRLLDDGEKEKNRLEIRLASLEEVHQELNTKFEDAQKYNEEQKSKLDHYSQQLSDYEGEINLLRRKIEAIESDREKDKKTIVTLNSALMAARANLDDETLRHIDAENKRQTLEEELEFLKGIHEQELKELAALAYRDTTSENRDYWKNEMGNALREIQEMYDEKLDIMRSEVESSYSNKLQEFRNGATKQSMESNHSKEETKRLKLQFTELRDKFNDLETKNLSLIRELELVKRQKDEIERELEHENSELKGEIARLRAELESILQELQHIMDTKLGLELEIAAYRKLLEGEESRGGLRQVVDLYAAGGAGGAGGYGFGLGGGGGGVGYADGSGSVAGGGGGGSGSAYGSGSGFGFGGEGGGAGGGSLSFNAGGGVSGAGGFPKGEISSRTSFQKSAKGPTAISECSADGKCIVIENTGRKVEVLDGWTLVRTTDDVDTLNYTFGKDSRIGPNDKLRIWAKGAKPKTASPSDIEAVIDNLGVGSNITTKLFNALGEDRATHIQKTIYG